LNIQKIISDAISTGEIITIVYDGGSQPGTKRQISPIHISNSMVRARCLNSNEIKLFSLSKIRVVSNTDSFKSYNPNSQKPAADEPCNLSEILSKHINEFKALKFHLEIRENYAAAHRVLENGGIVEKPDVIIAKTGKNKKRPWTVTSPSPPDLIIIISIGDANTAPQETSTVRNFSSIRTALKHFAVKSIECSSLEVACRGMISDFF
jgi:hypothetical protein